jgi:N-terminal acetyltransferase B complex non-catalytic subunit
MFKAAVRDRYWDLAQQVFVWLQKEYPSNTYYHFMWILFTHLRATACQTEFPEDRTAGQLFETLAFRSLDAAVANTLNKKDTSKRIQSLKELRLLFHVYEDQGRYEELLKVLNSPMIGIDSELAKGDDSFKRLRLDILVKLQKEREVYDLCFSSLNALLDAMHSSTGDVPLDLVWIDDLDIWTFLIDAADGEDDPDSWRYVRLTEVQ